MVGCYFPDKNIAVFIIRYSRRIGHSKTCACFYSQSPLFSVQPFRRDFSGVIGPIENKKGTHASNVLLSVVDVRRSIETRAKLVLQSRVCRYSEGKEIREQR